VLEVLILSGLREHGTCVRKLLRNNRKSDDKEQGLNTHMLSEGDHGLILSLKE
jgi:hypothetical protein